MKVFRVHKLCQRICIIAKVVQRGLSYFKGNYVKKVAFKGKSLNTQYNISGPVYNSYNINEKAKEGQKLSVVTK